MAMVIRHRSRGWAAALLFALPACATTNVSDLAVARAEQRAAVECFEAARSRSRTQHGLASCNAALADPALALELRAATLVNRGVIHTSARDFEAALADYDAAIAAAPVTADAYTNKGIVLLHMGGRDAEAVAVFTEALVHNPDRPEIVHFHRAGAYEGLGLLRDAYADYAEAALLAPDWAEPATQLQRFKFVRRKTMAG